MQDSDQTLPNGVAKPRAAGKQDPRVTLWRQFLHSMDTGQMDQEIWCLRQLLLFDEGAENEAWCLLALGCKYEQLGDFPEAMSVYRRGLALEPTAPFTWYFLHNNLGFCLNAAGRFAEGEVLCRRAIRINPGRSNGYKNLGLALKGQGRWREAARAFVSGVEANPNDERSAVLLDQLLREHSGLRAEFEFELAECRRAVQRAYEQRVQAEAKPEDKP